MLNIPCPWCGLRPHVEFTYGGDATKQRPADDATTEQWIDYVYLRDNPCGPHLERWHHHAGCRQWFAVNRNTRTHAFLDAQPASA